MDEPVITHSINNPTCFGPSLLTGWVGLNPLRSQSIKMQSESVQPAYFVTSVFLSHYILSIEKIIINSVVVSTIIRRMKYITT